MKESLYCPKCGEQVHGAYALLGHIYTSHYIADKEELREI